MPPGKTRRKDDTWTTEDLTEALKGPRSEMDKKDKKERRRNKEDVNGDDGRRRHKDDDKKSRKKDDEDHRGKGHSRDYSPEPRVELTEEDRDRLRQERRDKRGGDSKRKEERPRKEEKGGDSDEDAKRRSKREGSARRHRRRDDEDDGDKKRRHGDEDGERRRHKDKEKESRHRDRDDGDKRQDDDEERERRRQERRERREQDRGGKRDDEDRKERHRDREERHRDKEDRHKDRDREDRHKDRDREDRHKDRDREDRHKDRDREDRHKDRDREERHKDRGDRREKDKDRDQEREERRERREREKEEQRRQEEEERKRKEEAEKAAAADGGGDDDYNDYDDDFEDYEDDFEDGDDLDEETGRRRKTMDGMQNGKVKVNFRSSRVGTKKCVASGGVATCSTIVPTRRLRKFTFTSPSCVPPYSEMLSWPEVTAFNPTYAMAYTLDYESPSRMGYFVKIEEGEMEEVLRALDEENARLTSLSHRSNWSDSTELSDERFKEGEEPTGRPGAKDEQPTRPRTFINFVSAKQRVMDQSVASKARRRADDLKNMIELDTVYYDLFDLPPVREYDLYIRSFGRSNTKQAYVQTNEDAVERDVQTEEVDDLDKWTQHPPEDSTGVGGEGITVISGGGDEKADINNPEAMSRISKFLERTAQMINVILEEEKIGEDGESQARERNSNVSLSEGVTQLGCPPYLSGRHIEKVSFCPMQPNMFLTLHSQPAEPSPENVMDSYGLICVWSVKETATPQKVLSCLSQPTCACFSPSRAALVIAGMHDGSVMVWDLREPSSLHRSVNIEGQELTTRFPTYNTAGVLEKENHLSPVISITAVHPTLIRKEGESNSAAELETGLSFQLASVEENATVNLWVVTEISNPDMAGSEVDLGLAPGGRVKLLRSSAIVLDNPNKLVTSGKLRALDLKLSPSDLNHFFVATDQGQIIHGVRFGSRVFPRAYQSEIDSPRQITCLDFSPFGEPYFLAGCDDGSVHLYHASLKHPLASWPVFSEGHSIVSVQWSRSRPAVFLVLAENSTLYTFDLVDTGLTPVKADQITSGRVTSMAVGSDPALIGGNKALPAHVILALDNGSAELHTVSSSLRQQQPLETDFLTHYTERF